MKTYPEIAGKISEVLITKYKEKGFGWMTGFIHGIQVRKGSKEFSNFLAIMRNLLSEGLNPCEIIESLNLTDPKVLGQNIINDWNYPESIDTERLEYIVRDFSEKYEITKEEVLFFMLVNYMNALTISMVDKRPR